jgi:pantetheine-phosphate adenylyltransferase
MTKAMYPGSFDPITIGHLDIIKRASKLFEELYIVIMVNPKKNYTFDENQRKSFIEECIKDLENVKVIIGEGLTVNMAKSLDCGVLIRGIRAVVDYEYELQQATTNMILNQDIETVFLVSRPEYSFLSSSIAKEIARYGGDTTDFIPGEIYNMVIDKLQK